MSSPDDNSTKRALAREWAAARIVVLGGLVLALAVAGYFAFQQWRAERAAEQAQAVHAGVVQPKLDAKTVRAIEVAVCRAEIEHAKELTVVPSYAVLGSPNLVRTKIDGRFICEARTHLTQYFVSADFLCAKLGDVVRDPRCISVYRVMLPDGRLVYSRPE